MTTPRTRGLTPMADHSYMAFAQAKVGDLGATAGPGLLGRGAVGAGPASDQLNRQLS